MSDWTELEQETIQCNVGAPVTKVKVQAIPVYPACWWRWEIRTGGVSVMMSKAEAEHFARLVTARMGAEG